MMQDEECRANARVEALQRVRSTVNALNRGLDSLSAHVFRLLPRRNCGSSVSPRRSAVATGPRQSPVSLRGAPFAAAIPGNTVVEQVLTTGISSFLNLYNTVLIGRIILTWFPSAPPAIVSPLSTVTDPYLNLFRGIIPPLGGTLDLSPILAFVALDLFTNAAAALPCESRQDGERLYREHRVRELSPSGIVLAFRKQRAAERRSRIAG